MTRIIGTLVFMAVLVAASGTALLRGEKAAVQAGEDDLATNLVGSWRGHAVYVHPGNYFYRVDAAFKFTDWGAVFVELGPLVGGAGGVRTRGDYLVVGNAIVMRLDAMNPSNGSAAKAVSVTVTRDRLEFVEANCTVFLMCGAFVLTRE